MTAPGPQVVNDPRGSRFAVEADGHTAELVYRVVADRLVLIHTEVPEAIDGRGLGSDLVRAAIEHAVEHRLTVVPKCPFARGWLERHPEEASRVTIDWPEGTAPT